MTSLRKKFVVVYGGPRTGTSLTCDLVKVCDYNFGNTKKGTAPREGRLEHRFCSAPYNPLNDKWAMDFIDSEGINAAKVIGFPEWIDFLIRKDFDVRLLLTHRNKASRNASARSMLLHLPMDQKVPMQERDIAKREKWLKSHPEVRRLDVHFEKLVDKDEDQLIDIVNFIAPLKPNVVDTVDRMLEVIEPSRVKFRG